MRKRIRENFRIEIAVDEKNADDVKRQIRRFITGIGAVSVRCDDRCVCEYCGRDWCNAPSCCEEAQREHDEAAQ